MSESDDQLARKRAMLARKRAWVPPPPFSLEAFYAERRDTGAADAPLPEFSARTDLPEVETSRVGVCPPIEPRDPE